MLARVVAVALLVSALGLPAAEARGSEGEAPGTLVLLEDFARSSAHSRLARAFAAHERRRVALDETSQASLTEEAAERTLLASRTLLSE